MVMQYFSLVPPFQGGMHMQTNITYYANIKDKLMIHTSMENINNDILSTVYHTIESNEEVSISTPKGAVIMLAQDKDNQDKI